MDALTVAYSDRYLRWNLGDGHPTDPRRAQNLLRLMNGMVRHNVVIPRDATEEEMLSVHSPEYLDGLLDGYCDEWDGERLDLASVAVTMAGGTMGLVDGILAGEVKRGFNPQGAKHHAHRDHSSGFCVLNDMAMAAHRFVVAGMRVAYIDWDVHHGDGVEAICRSMPDVATASIHGRGFPGTGLRHEPTRSVWNYPMAKADTTQWVSKVEEAFARLAEHRPDVLLVATGADAHVMDPLGSLNVHVDGYAQAGWLARQFADTYCEGRVLIGGAGGYQPDFWTPMCWLAVAKAME